MSADRQQTAEWRVDLQSVVSISYIKIFYRTDNVPSPSVYVTRFAGFFLYVSNTTSKEDGHLCFHEIQTLIGTPVEDQRINCSVYGRYVIYYNERNNPNVNYPSYYSNFAFNELCELEVYGCPVLGYFGQNCNRLCPEKCQEKQCDAVTGNCVKGCLPGYQGVHCNYGNLALGKQAWQQYPYSNTIWGADKAVDGLYTNRGAGGNQCTVSADRHQTAELRVDLGSVVSISYINIFYRTENSHSFYFNLFSGRFAGFLVYVSNTTTKGDGNLCFHEIQEENGRPSLDQRIDCSVHGRYVIYFNERRPGITYPSYYSSYAFSGLCELEVYGCLDAGFFGQNCEQLCPENCQEQRCHITTGECLGCVPGYKGLQCSQECDTQTYGLECSGSCGYCNNGETCDHVNGTCLKGCNEGYKGDKCETTCQPGTYGKNCVHVCSVTCGVTSRCDRFTGKCEGGCQPGWKGDKCDQKCNSREYGVNCSQVCGYCLDDDQCNHINGECSGGCSTGYKGQLCKTVCGMQTYGPECSENCGNCSDGVTCHHINGTCLNGCNEGVNGDKCNTTCQPGTYGKNCVHVCSVTCGVTSRCDRFSGKCERGCQPGWKGDQCDQILECDGGMYGINCTQSCGHCLNNEQCHHINGSCLHGCSPGYKGPGCITKCDRGMYGINCSQVCGYCLNYEQCHYINGTCLQGCSKGYKGSLCNSVCDGGMYGNNCNQSCGHCIKDIPCNHVSGLCFEGCSIGFKGLLCDKVCDSGMYGVNCNQVCGNCLNNEQCHHINGTCLQGCSKGYKGSLCNIACEGGKYGYNCNQSCGHCFNNTQCNHLNGACPEGCSVGYDGPLCTNVCRRSHWGVNCKETCKKDCVSQTCHHETGQCISYAQVQSCNTSKNDYTITITSVVVSILIVLMGSLLNYVIWRKMQQKGPVLDTPNDKDYYNEFRADDIGDKQKRQDMNTSPYAELSEFDHPNTYEEIHKYGKADEKM